MQHSKGATNPTSSLRWAAASSVVAITRFRRPPSVDERRRRTVPINTRHKGPRQKRQLFIHYLIHYRRQDMTPPFRELSGS